MELTIPRKLCVRRLRGLGSLRIAKPITEMENNRITRTRIKVLGVLMLMNRRQVGAVINGFIPGFSFGYLQGWLPL